MTNPQDNPGTPPQPTPFDSSISPPPSTSPKPRLRRVKMLARKMVASGALRKKLNEKLKGEGPGSSDSKKDQESPSKNVELPELRRSGGRREWPEVRGSGSGEAAEGLVHQSTQRDEPGLSTEETLADLLKKVGASYDLKKRRTLTPKAPSVPKLSKKRKASSPTITKISLPKGRATKSRVKQSESDLQRALAESKKKMLAKGKVADSSEAVEVEEMEQVYQEEVQIVEVQTPKPKKPKTSSMKSSFVSEVVEPSLAKRTRSIVKKKLGEILDIPSEGFDDYNRQMWPCLDSLPIALEITRRFCDAEDVNESKTVQKSEMRP
uniref:Coiled-coil domain-containing protein 86-like n=1 Tax=Nicotiana sylvestris TaxID=4096 RepID=A0A1U7V8R6_NICSY|nr:PREDICTED: coiled-coil domain-containing protein 86-like [Nicotiana sylvestris]